MHIPYSCIKSVSVLVINKAELKQLKKKRKEKETFFPFSKYATGVRAYVSVCVRACVRACMCVCVCVCVFPDSRL